MFDSALFDGIVTASPSGSTPASTFVVTNTTPNLYLGSNYQFFVVFDQNLTVSTTVNITDGVTASSVTVPNGSNYGLIGYTPTSIGTKTFAITHSGQSGISNPVNSLTANVINAATVVNTSEPEEYLSKPDGVKFYGYSNTFISF